MFYTGNFTSFETLKTSIETALQNHGWGLNGDGTLEKNGMYVRLVAGTIYQIAAFAGTGSSLPPAPLPGAPAYGVKIMNFSGSPMNFPATYDLHVFEDTDEVYLVVNYNGDKYQQLSFGKSRVDQVGGTGMWLTGSFRSDTVQAATHLVYTSAGGSSAGFGWSGMGCGLFFDAYNAALGCSYIHTGLDTTGWKTAGSNDGNLLGSGDPMAGLLQALPSQFNQSTVLLPLYATQRRLSKGQTIVADLQNARLCRNDNHLSGEIVTYGTDRWKIYPFHRKNAAVRNGVSWSTGADHSGTFAYAIRYTGP
ncbi:structural protein [Stenotrophomonas phage vB_SmaS_Bhz60]